jgi:spectinomycin phosphotransferase
LAGRCPHPASPDYPPPVHERSPDIADAEVAAALRGEWQLDLDSLDYVPAGFGGHHWLAVDASGRRWFVTVQAAAGPCGTVLAAALETATALAAAGLDFVVPPVRSPAGRLLAPLGDGLIVSMSAYHDGMPGRWGDTLTSADAAALARMLADLHAAAVTVPVPVRPLELACRHVLATSLRERAVPWRGGPFAEPARAVLAEHAQALAGALGRFDALVAEVSADGRPLVITHGEPHPGNLLQASTGLLLVDWDTVGLAPAERDLWWLPDTAAYTGRTRRAVSRAALELYRLRWTLDDVSTFLAEFRAPHRRSADAEVSWAGLRSGLQGLTESGL